MSLSVFNFEGFDVRFVGTAEAPEWVAQDVCKILDIKNVSDAIDRLEPYQKGSVVITDTSSSTRKTISVLTVKEPGLYALIFASRKPSAKRFQRWVFEEVLPSIRKTGSYSIDSSRDDLRLSSTEVRKETMVALSEAGFTKPHHFINVTQMVYRGLFDMDAAQLRVARGLSDKVNVRDHLTTEELGMVRTLELLVKQVLITKVFTSSADLNKYVKTISQGMKAVGGVDPKLFVDGNK
jgi:prophage antirepressor-like protein